MQMQIQMQMQMHLHFALTLTHCTYINTYIMHADAKAISAGGWHSMVLKKDGTVWATGWNKYGQFGDGTKLDKRKFVKVLPGQ